MTKRTRLTARRVALAALLAIACAAPARAGGSGCGEWLPSGSVWPGLDGPVYAAVPFVDAAGPCFVLGGEFTIAGAVLATNVVRFDGVTFSPLGAGVDDEVLALHVFDDGSGPALYAGGRFDTAGGAPARRVAKWDGERWSALGSGIGGVVESFTTFDDGTGRALVVGGNFSSAGGVPANRVAKWDGSSFTPLGDGITGGSGGHVRALAAFDDGTGEALFAAGTFRVAGGTSVFRIAKWDGAEWSGLGTGLQGDDFRTEALALAVYDDGGGPALFVGGVFDFAGGVPVSNVARWDGVSFSALGSGTSGEVWSFAVYDDGDGPALCAGGPFLEAGGVTVGNIASWDGAAWSILGPGFVGPAFALAPLELPGRRLLLLGGSFQSVHGGPGSHAALFDGTSFSTFDFGFDGDVGTIAAFDDGSGPVVLAAGSFTLAPGAAADGFARFDGASWSDASGGGPGEWSVTFARQLFVLDLGSGPETYVSGGLLSPEGEATSRVARWTGAAWEPVGGAFDSAPFALEVFDDGGGPALVAGGGFRNVGSGPAASVARFDGVEWVELGGGIASRVYALAAFDDGSGPALVAGGEIESAGGAPASGVARWNGAAWSPLAAGDLVNGVSRGTAYDLAVLDDGGGPALFVGGNFNLAGGAPAWNVARFDGVAWSAVGSGTDRYVLQVEAGHDGDRPVLFAGGLFAVAGGIPALGVARWDGAEWSPLGSGLVRGIGERVVEELFVASDGTLYAGGTFAAAGGMASSHFGIFGHEPSPLRDGNVDVGRSGVPARVLTVSGESGDPACGRVLVASGTEVTVSIAKPPAGGAGHYLVWTFDGAPTPGAAVPIRLRRPAGIFDLGLGCRPLPTDNLVTPGTCPSPLAFARGRSSKRLGAATAAALFVRSGVSSPRAPFSFTQAFPRGVFTVCGVVSDPGSPNAAPVSIANWVVVESK